MIRISDIALPFDHKQTALIEKILSILKISENELTAYRIVRKSIDARRRNQILTVYTLDVRVGGEGEILTRFSNNRKVSAAPCSDYVMPNSMRTSGLRPVIVGTGPCGLFAGLILAQAGLKPILIDRGKDVESRVRDVNRFWKNALLDTESNAQFGEGGAGTFSDGKLTTQIKDKSNRINKVLLELIAAGAPEEILYQARPHVGTDNLIGIVRNIRRTIVSLGGQVRFETKLTDIKIADGKVTGVVVNGEEVIDTDATVLALGHSARDTFEMLFGRGVEIKAKPFSIGVRIEHPQSVVDTAQYGKYAGCERLGAADYKLVAHCANGKSAYTFCMCPGGEVIACASEQGGVVVNGMSRFKRDGVNANSALLVGVGPADFGSDDPMAAIEFQRRWEKRSFEIAGGDYSAPVQLVGDFINGVESGSLGQVQPTYKPAVALCDLSGCLPQFVIETLRAAIPEMDKKLRGFAMNDAVMTAVESRSSCPVRIVRGDDFQSVSVNGLYPAGEGAGYAGGIMSAAVDGIKIAEAVCVHSEK